MYLLNSELSWLSLSFEASSLSSFSISFSAEYHLVSVSLENFQSGSFLRSYPIFTIFCFISSYQKIKLIKSWTFGSSLNAIPFFALSFIDLAVIGSSLTSSLDISMAMSFRYFLSELLMIYWK